MTKRRILAVALPWAAALFSCAVVAVLVLNAFAIRGRSEAEEPGENMGVVQTALRTIEEGVLSALSMVPTGKSSSPIVAAIIENHKEARDDQQGLTEAIAVFEMIVEGDITRFLALYSANDLPKNIGPCRSLRLAFLEATGIYRPLYLHIGGNHLAYEYLQAHPELRHHDGIRYDGKTYHRDAAIPAPHNVFMDQNALNGVLKDTKGLRDVPLPLFPYENTIPDGAKPASEITVDLQSPDHNVTYTYDAFERRYRRAIAGAPRQSLPANVLLLETVMDGYGTPGAIPWTKTFGKGRLFFATRGKIFEGTWMREEEGAFSFKDPKGNALPFSRGQTWIMMIPSLRAVKAK